MRRIERQIAIIGAGQAGRLLQRDIESNYRSYQIAGFLDDDADSNTPNLLGTIDDCQRIATTSSIDEFIIAIPSATGQAIRKILLANLNHRIPIRIVPRSQRIIGQSDVRYEEVKEIEPEDFLGRPFINTNVDRLTDFYQDKTVLVTGGAGSIGSEIVRQLLDLRVTRVIVYDNSEYLTFLLEQQLRELGQIERCSLIIGSILNAQKLNFVLAEHRPDIVFHAAAYKHVHLMQENIDEAISNNVLGTKQLVDSVSRHKIPQFTFISTDKVVNPTSVMGATKKLCEYYIDAMRDTDTTFNIVRFGNVINSNGSVLPLFERQISQHQYVTVTHKEMQRFFMSIREAAQLVIESTAAGRENAVHLLNMGELINVYDVAVSLIRSKNLLPGIDVEVRVTGLRKGEKLIEELYTEAESTNLTSTADNRMFSLQGEPLSSFDIHAAIAELGAGVANDGNGHVIRAALLRLFPSLQLPAVSASTYRSASTKTDSSLSPSAVASNTRS